MKFDFNGKHYRMWFKHTLYPTPQRYFQKNSAKERLIKGETVCEIGVLDASGLPGPATKREEFRVIATGVSHCAVSDPFNEAKGRSDALKRALQNLGQLVGSKEVIEVGFEAYSNRPRPTHADYLKQEIAKLQERLRLAGAA